jgi:hypothetical protein
MEATRSLMVIIGLLAAAGASVRADTVVLHGGARLTGSVEAGRREFVVRTADGTVTLPARRVAQVLAEDGSATPVPSRSPACENVAQTPDGEADAPDEALRAGKPVWRVYDVSDLLVSFGDWPAGAAGGRPVERAQRLALVMQGCCGEGTWAAPGIGLPGLVIAGSATTAEGQRPWARTQPGSRRPAGR